MSRVTATATRTFGGAGLRAFAARSCSNCWRRFWTKRHVTKPPSATARTRIYVNRLMQRLAKCKDSASAGSACAWGRMQRGHAWDRYRNIDHQVRQTVPWYEKSRQTHGSLLGSHGERE